MLIEGERDCRDYMLEMFDDWQAPGITAILHERRGGYANNVRSLRGLAAKAEAEGVRIVTGVRVTGIRTSGGAVTAVQPTRARSPATSWSSRPARGSVTCGPCWICRSGSR